MKLRTPELLSPAGDPEKLRYAVMYGADAVYCALKSFGMRSQAGNFTPDELAEGIRFAHSRSCSVYVTLNTMPHEVEYKELQKTLESIESCLPDAFIVSDPGIIRVLKNMYPDVPLHLSTQCSVVNSGTCMFWYELGIKRIVLARELTLDEIRQIRSKLPCELELEAFVHGAMCVSYSGRCLISDYLTRRAANSGACTQPCRYKYYVTEQTRPEQHMPAIQDENGTYLFSSRDLCMIDHLKELRDAGVSSFKIEGRMKSAYYTAITANAYRMAIDAIDEGTPNGMLMDMLCGVSHREYDTGFYFNAPSSNANICSTEGYIRDRAFLATVEERCANGLCKCIQRNKMYAGETVRLISPGKYPRNATVGRMYDMQMIPIEMTPHPKMEFYLEIKEANKGDIICSDK